MTEKEFEKLLLETKVAGFNAGYGKEVRRVAFCEEAGKWVEQEFGYYNSQTEKEWFCLHE